jgi:hypothetical protein
VVFQHGVSLQQIRKIQLAEGFDMSDCLVALLSEVDIVGPATHDATGLAFLVMALNPGFANDLVDHVAGVVPMEGHYIMTLFEGFGLVVVEEEAFHV